MDNDPEAYDYIYDNDFDEEIDAENKETCADIRKISINIFEELFGFIESVTEPKAIIAARAFSVSLGKRLASIINSLEKDGQVSVEEKCDMSSEIFAIMDELDALICELPAISQHLKKEEGRRRAEKARMALPDISWRDDEIFRRANKALIKKPTLSGRSSAMAHELLDGVNDWIKHEKNDPDMKMKLGALIKVLSRNREKWKSK
jgi:hypothetical protein